MIQKLEISGVHTEVGDDLRKYVLKKIGQLDKYLPKHARQSAHAEVRLKEQAGKTKSDRTCEVVLYLPKEVLTVTETTINIYAAIDIAEAKLKTRLHKYKELHDVPKLRRRVLGRLRRRTP
jgi:ribosomal subunit interface protein